MGVRVHKSRQDHSTVQINFARSTGGGKAFNAALGADSGDMPIFDKDCAILDNAEISKGTSAMRCGATERENLRAICDEQGIWFFFFWLGHWIPVHGTEKQSDAQDAQIERELMWKCGVYCGRR